MLYHILKYDGLFILQIYSLSWQKFWNLFPTECLTLRALSLKKDLQLLQVYWWVHSFISTIMSIYNFTVCTCMVALDRRECSRWWGPQYSENCSLVLSSRHYWHFSPCTVSNLHLISNMPPLQWYNSIIILLKDQYNFIGKFKSIFDLIRPWVSPNANTIIKL